jgi:Cdc6-like AAA superfamily ATPase
VIQKLLSALPPAGKSHTVRKVLQQLLASHPDAATITWVNCMSINTASEVYAQIAASADGSSNFTPLPATTSSNSSAISSSCLDDDDLTADINNCSSISSSCSTGVTTYQQLVERLGKPPSSSSTSSRAAPKSYRASRSSSKQQQVSRRNENDAAPTTRTPGNKRSTAKDQQATPNSIISRRHIIVLDEIDNLAKKSHADLVQLFLLPQQPGLQLLLVGIANSIDLTERTLPELKLRMASPQLLCFPAYSTKQLGCILAACMEALPAK